MTNIEQNGRLLLGVLFLAADVWHAVYCAFRVQSGEWYTHMEQWPRNIVHLTPYYLLVTA